MTDGGDAPIEQVERATLEALRMGADLIPCEGSACPTHSGMCAMCGRMVETDDDWVAADHGRPDILALLRGQVAREREAVRSRPGPPEPPEEFQGNLADGGLEGEEDSPITARWLVAELLDLLQRGDEPMPRLRESMAAAKTWLQAQPGYDPLRPLAGGRVDAPEVRAIQAGER